VPDDRYTGKVRCFAKPIVFGGDAQAESNVQSVSHAQHAELVRWWNAQHRAAVSKTR
jgi:hypothetical protein